MPYNCATGLYDGYIYCIENNVTHKKYVGQTCTTVEHRYYHHLRAAYSEKYAHLLLYRAMRKYGIEAFSVTELEHLSAGSPEELKSIMNAREKYHIELLGTYTPHGYNMTMGGDSFAENYSRAVYQTDDDGRVLRRYKSVLDAELDNRITRGCVGYAASSRNHYSGGYHWFYCDEYGDDVEHINIPAQKKTGHPGNRYRAYPVMQLTMERKPIAVYGSTVDAAAATGVCQASISKCCLGRRANAGGFIWMRVSNLQ